MATKIGTFRNSRNKGTIREVSSSRLVWSRFFYPFFCVHLFFYGYRLTLRKIAALSLAQLRLRPIKELITYHFLRFLLDHGSRGYANIESITTFLGEITGSRLSYTVYKYIKEKN